MKLDIAQARLKELLHYDPISGQFTWLVPSSNRVKRGATAGTPDNYGYLRIGIDGVRYRSHRLAWLYMHGSLPELCVDHVNGDRGDNRIGNLRIATHAENHQNRAKHSNNTTGYLGVGWKPHLSKFIAQIRIDGRTKHLGVFDTAEEAAEAYKSAKKILHPFSPEART